MMTVRGAFEVQSRACAALGSPFMERLMALAAERLAPGAPVADRVLGWTGDPSPFADSVPLRLAGALHALRLEGLALSEVYPPREVPDDRLWSAVEAAFRDHEARLLEWLGQAPQTNEVRRASAILPAIAAACEGSDQPVELIELGCSGGLNLRCDRFRLDVPGGSLGDPASEVVLSPGWTGASPPVVLPTIAARTGVDVAPLDPATEAGGLGLLAYLWPDQTDRLDRTRRAIDIARATPAQIDKDDAGRWLERHLATPDRGLKRIVFHTVAWQYFPEATSRRALAAMDSATSPLVRIGMEADGAEDGARLWMTRYPEGETVELGRADFHGRWIDWRC